VQRAQPDDRARYAGLRSDPLIRKPRVGRPPPEAYSRTNAPLRRSTAQTVLWVVRDRRTIRGYAVSAHVHHPTVAERLRRGIGALADHYRFAMPMPAWDAGRPDDRSRPKPVVPAQSGDPGSRRSGHVRVASRPRTSFRRLRAKPDKKIVDSQAAAIPNS
jgi:hypothetical protein